MGVGEVANAEDGLGECIDRPSPDGRLGMGIGMVGDCGGEEGAIGKAGRVGDAGRLTKELVVGVLGVLDGLGPKSKGSVGKLLNIPPSLRVSRGGSFDGVVIVVVGCEALPLMLPPVGIDGTICHPLTSSSSSIDGKACENSVRYDDDVCGEEEGEEVGDGGPRLERGTKACGEGAVEFDAESGCAVGGAKFDDVEANAEERLELEYRFRMASGDTGGVGNVAVVGRSREKRLLVGTTERPASWRDRMRSAMLPPDLRSVPFVLEWGR